MASVSDFWPYFFVRRPDRLSKEHWSATLFALNSLVKRRGGPGAWIQVPNSNNPMLSNWVCLNERHHI
jgi:hypothetical protein